MNSLNLKSAQARNLFTAGIALILVMSAVSVGPGHAGLVPPSPLLINEVTGELQIELSRVEGAWTEDQLPFVASGSTLRVLSGTARLTGGYGVLIKAARDANFSYTASADPGRLNIALVGAQPGRLEVRVADKLFFLEDEGSAMSIAAGEAGAVRVSVTGRVELAIDNDAPGGDSGFPRSSLAIPPGSWMSVAAPTANAAYPRRESLSAWRVTRSGDGAVVVKDPYRGRKAPGVDELNASLDQWPEQERLVTKVMIDRYGFPGYISATEIQWNNNGPWNSTIVHRARMPGFFPRKPPGMVVQSVRYRIAPSQIELLSELPGEVHWNRDTRELSSSSGSEEMNFLALNVADKFLTGSLSFEEAHSLYARTQALSRAGKHSSLMTQLEFSRP